MWGRTEWLGAEYSVLGDFLWTLLTGQSQGRGLNAHVQHVSRDRKAGSVSTGSAVATSPGLERPQGWSAHARPQPRDIRGLGLTLVRRSRLEGPPPGFGGPPTRTVDSWRRRLGSQAFVAVAEAGADA